MPPICLHLGIAEEAASKMNQAVLERWRGDFLLGSTAPDVRVFTGASREDTHFLSLESEEEQSGVGPMLQRHPGLARSGGLNDETKAFVAGYLSHLVTDEAWIYCIYRPFFGKGSPRGNDPSSSLLDRALQFELERREQADAAEIKTMRSRLVDSGQRVHVGFLDGFSLAWWRDFVISSTLDQPARAGLRAFADEYMAHQYRTGHACNWSLGAALEQSLRRALDIVPEDQIRAFREHAVVRTVAAAGEYLG